MSYERRKVRVGKVVSDKMDKTVVVVYEWSRPHPIYKKAVRRQTKFYAHDPRTSAALATRYASWSRGHTPRPSAGR